MTEIGLATERARGAAAAAPGLAAGAAARDEARLALVMGLLLMLAALLPVLDVKIPALIDYPNHLGRIHTMAMLGTDPFLTRFYGVEWQIVPNLAVDILLPLLAKHMSVYVAGRLFVMLCMVLWIGGAFAMHRAFWGRLSPAPLAGFLILYNFIFLFGFLNYLFAVGLAFWAIAAWFALERRPLARGLVSLAFVLALFAAHLFAVGVYGLVLLAAELQRMHRRQWRLPPVPELLAFALPFLAVPLLLLASPTAGHSLDIKYSLESKFFGLFYVIKNFNNPIDLGIGLVIAAVAFIFWRRGFLRFHPLTPWLLAVAIPVYLVMPDVLLGSWAADRRLPIAVAFVLVALSRWELPRPRMRYAAVAAVAALALVRFAVIDYYWRWFDHIFAQVEASVRDIEPGAKVLVGQLEFPELRYTFRHFLFHAPCLAMIERSAMVPSAFTNPGKQIMHVNPGYLQYSDFYETPLPVQQSLVQEVHFPNPAPPPSEYWAGWQKRFDYLYVMYQPKTDNPLPKLLTPLYQGDEFTLYRIERR